VSNNIEEHQGIFFQVTQMLLINYLLKFITQMLSIKMMN